MEDTDSSSYFCGLLGMVARQSHGNIAFLPESKTSMSPALVQFLIQLDAAYKYQLSLRKTHRKRTLPPVPRFEDTEVEPAIEKKIKEAPADQLTTNALSSMKTRITETTSPPNMHFDTDESTQSAETFCKIEMEEEKAHNVFLGDIITSSLSQNSRFTPKEEELHECSTVDSPISQPYEDVSENPSAKYSEQTEYSYSSLEMSDAALDKKDLKKIKKFESCMREYLQKLSITDSAVEKRYQELLRLVVPQLSTHFKSKPFEAIAAAVLLYACRDVQYPITIRQITQATDAKEKIINKCIFSIKQVLPDIQEVKHFKADEFILVIGEKLRVSDMVMQAALKIHGNIERMNFLKSNHASTLACCCIKIASALSGEDREFDEIAEKAGINKMTLRNMYRDLYPYRMQVTAKCRFLKTIAELPNI